MRRSDGRRRADSAAVTGGRGVSANSEELGGPLLSRREGDRADE